MKLTQGKGHIFHSLGMAKKNNKFHLKSFSIFFSSILPHSLSSLFFHFRLIWNTTSVEKKKTDLYKSYKVDWSVYNTWDKRIMERITDRFCFSDDSIMRGMPSRVNLGVHFSFISQTIKSWSWWWRCCWYFMPHDSGHANNQIAKQNQPDWHSIIFNGQNCSKL